MTPVEKLGIEISNYFEQNARIRPESLCRAWDEAKDAELGDRELLQRALDALLTCKADAEEEGFGFIQDHVIHVLQEALLGQHGQTERAQAQLAAKDAVIAKKNYYLLTPLLDWYNSGREDHMEFLELCHIVTDVFYVKGQAEMRERAAEVPPGFKLVPIEPTDAMVDAMNRVPERHNTKLYLAALAAAPECSIQTQPNMLT